MQGPGLFCRPSLTQMHASWRLNGGEIELMKYGTRLTEGMVHVGGTAYLSELAKRDKARPKPKSDI